MTTELVERRPSNMTLEQKQEWAAKGPRGRRSHRPSPDSPERCHRQRTPGGARSHPTDCRMGSEAAMTGALPDPAVPDDPPLTAVHLRYLTEFTQWMHAQGEVRDQHRRRMRNLVELMREDNPRARPPRLPERYGGEEL